MGTHLSRQDAAARVRRGCTTNDVLRDKYAPLPASATSTGASEANSARSDAWSVGGIGECAGDRLLLFGQVDADDGGGGDDDDDDDDDLDRSASPLFLLDAGGGDAEFGLVSSQSSGSGSRRRKNSAPFFGSLGRRLVLSPRSASPTPPPPSPRPPTPLEVGIANFEYVLRAANESFERRVARFESRSRRISPGGGLTVSGRQRRRLVASPSHWALEGTESDSSARGDESGRRIWYVDAVPNGDGTYNIAVDGAHTYVDCTACPSALEALAAADGDFLRAGAAITGVRRHPGTHELCGIVYEAAAEHRVSPLRAPLFTDDESASDDAADASDDDDDDGSGSGGDERPLAPSPSRVVSPRRASSWRHKRKLRKRREDGVAGE
jgi:hypothetical protein